MMIIKTYIIEILILTLISILLFYSSDPVIYNDSGRYLKSGPNIPPLYPFIIEIMQSIFKTLNSVVVLQTFFVGLGIIFFTNTVAVNFNLDFFTKILIALFLFLPIIKFYNNILTEPFGNAFSLLLMSCLIRSTYNLNIKNIVSSTFFAISLLLMRDQFMFLYPVILLIYLGLFIIHTSKKKFILLAISFLSIFLIHNSLVNLNKYIKKNSIENKTLLSSNSGVFKFLYIDSIYISTIQDVELFENQNLRKTLTEILKRVKDQKASLEYYDGRGHYGLSFAIIKNHSNFLLKDLALQEKISLIDLKKKISIILISKNFVNYIKLIFKKFYDSTWLFIFVPFFILIPALINFLKYKSNFSFIMFFLSIYTLANHSVVYLFGRVQPRYLIYSDFLILIFIFIAFSIFLKKEIKNEI